MRNIILIGPMGAGKTTIGRILANRLGWQFHDSDREIEKRTDGRWKPSAGSVYPTLQMLADEGLVTSTMEQDRKTYSLTDEAHEEAHAAAASAPWTSEDDDCDTSGVGSVAKAGVHLAQAVTLVARSGSTKQHEHAVEALDEARRKIYTILAQD